MEQKLSSPEKEVTDRLPVLYVAFELGNSTWIMACSYGRKVRQVTVTARDLDQVEGGLLRAQAHFATAKGCSVASCYEAGRDGFWPHRYSHSKKHYHGPSALRLRCTRSRNFWENHCQSFARFTHSPQMGL